MRVRKDYVPLLAMTGGLLTAFVEPLIDHMVHLWYPTSPNSAPTKGAPPLTSCAGQTNDAPSRIPGYGAPL